MVDKVILDELIWHILRGFDYGFNICSLIQEGVSYPKRIPQQFWLDERKGGDGILGQRFLSKAEMRSLRDEVIDAIINEINNPSEPDKMYSDNYTRRFHALAIFRVAKSDKRVPPTGNDYMYNIAYELWGLDDGSKRKYDCVRPASWYSAEAFKSGSRTSERLLTGMRHKAF